MSELYHGKKGVSMPDSKAKKRWDKEHTSVLAMKLNHNTDADIIRKLERVPNRQGYVKSLIRKDIANQKSE